MEFLEELLEQIRKNIESESQFDMNDLNFRMNRWGYLKPKIVQALHSAYSKGREDREKEIIDIIEYFDCEPFQSEYDMVIEKLVKKVSHKE